MSSGQIKVQKMLMIKYFRKDDEAAFAEDLPIVAVVVEQMKVYQCWVLAKT
jgi:hypothetical protein